MIQLQIYTSKKGTKVVTATHLYKLLQLSEKHYLLNIERWLSDVYEFRDGIRTPEKMRDFAPRKKEGELAQDYYLSVELAKLITLHSRSKVKLKYAKLLSKELDTTEYGDDVLTKKQVLALLGLTQDMQYVSKQEEHERKHLQMYKKRNGGSIANWWKHRAQILGYDAKNMKDNIKKRQNTSQGVLFKDQHELIRAGVIDFFMGIGKTARTARKFGDLAKKLAQTFNIEIFDDRINHQPTLFVDDQIQSFANIKKLPTRIKATAL